VQFFLKTFLRSIALNARQTYLYNVALAGALGTRLLTVLVFSYSMENWLIISIILDLIVFMWLQKFLALKSKEV
jgi:hypothetical protein